MLMLEEELRIKDTDFYENALATKNICEYGRLNNINHLAFEAVQWRT